MENADTKPKKKVTRPFFKHDPLVSIVAIVGIFLLSQFLAAIIVSLYPATKDWTDVQSQAWLKNSIYANFFYLLIAEIISVSLVYQLIKWAKVSLTRITKLKPNIGDLGWALVSYGLYFICYLALVVFVSAVVPGLDTQQKQQIGFSQAQGGVNLLIAFIALVLITPLVEEIIFRGYLYSSLRAKYRFWPSTIVTSIVFGVLHLQFGSNAPLLWIAAIDTFTLSIFMCYLRERRSSIWPAVFLHMLKNCVAFLLLFGTKILLL